jgi:[acyl-carrier-protein] S-malonyltransferase
VKWLQSIEKLRSLGVEKFIEVGPGKVLTGLLRQIDREAFGANVENGESLRASLETL